MALKSSAVILDVMVIFLGNFQVHLSFPTRILASHSQFGKTKTKFPLCPKVQHSPNRNSDFKNEVEKKT
jgi:hypothetical protein